jgi:HEAT repeat protein
MADPILITIFGKAFPALAKQLAAQIVGRVFKSILDNAAKKRRITNAVTEAIEHWLVALLRNFQALGFEEEEIRNFFPEYQRALSVFLTDEKVAEELLKPFMASGSRVVLNDEMLLERWHALELPKLPEDFNAASVTRGYLRRLEKARIVTSELRELYQAQLAKTQTDTLNDIRGVWPDFDLDQYAKQMKRLYRVLDLSALTPPERDDLEDARITLRDVFVPQLVKEHIPPRELPKEYWIKAAGTEKIKPGSLPPGLRPEELERVRRSWEEVEAEPIEEVLGRQSNKRLVLLGDPGSGKSTLARYLLLQVLDPRRDKDGTVPLWLNNLTNHLPLLVELRTYLGETEEGNCTNFLEYFHYLGTCQGYALNLTSLTEELKSRPSLVIFDGLDEIFDRRQRDKIIREIIGFAADYPPARMLITSRIIGYEGKRFQAADFRHYTLQDLSEDQIRSFAQGWFDIAYRNHPEEAIFRRDRINRALDNSPSIRHLAGNPLLLTMIAIIAKHQELPRERAKLYDHAVKVLCHHWDATGHKIAEEDTPADFMNEDDKLELLRRIARSMQTTTQGLAGNVILGDQLLHEIEAYLKARWRRDPVECTKIGRAMIHQLRERNFILCLYGPGVYGFVHRTILEYLFATEIVRRFEKKRSLSLDDLKKDIFAAHLRDPTWHEILRLICALVHHDIAGDLIRTILPNPRVSFVNTSSLILSIQCLAEVKNLNAIPAVCQSVLESLLTWFEYKPTSFLRAEFEKEFFFLQSAVPAIEAIGEEWPKSQALLEWVQAPNKKIDTTTGAQAFARTVSALLGNSRELKETLLTLIDLRHNAQVLYLAFTTLAHCFTKDSDVKSLLLEITTSEQSKHARHGAVHVLSQYYSDDPDIKDLFALVAQNDRDGGLRREALRALGQHHSDDPATKALLVKAAENDRKREVRRGALEILSQHFPRDPETKALLVRATQDDPDEWGRLSALRALGQTYTDDPETMALLVKAARVDLNEWVRRATLEALARHYTDDPETKALLVTAAQNDWDEGVRRAAMETLGQHYTNDPAIKAMLVTAAQDESAGWGRRRIVAALAAHYSDDPEIKALLVTMAQDDREEEVRHGALSSLARHYTDDPDTKGLLVTSLENDRNGEVRHIALGALAQHYTDDPETNALLVTAAQDDPDGEVRLGALDALGQHYTDDPETNALLVTAAQDDPDTEVRRGALKALSQYYTDDPNTKALLVAAAQDNPDVGVRRQALADLGQYYADDPEVKVLLVTAAQNDREGGVRLMALIALGQHYTDDPKTKTLLVTAVEDDRQARVRREAVMALAEHYTDDPETKGLLVTALENDRNGEVRHGAVTALAEHYTDDPGTRALLATAAQDDRKGEVRLGALEALGQHFTDNPETKPLLVKAANEDRSTSVRIGAMSTLATYYYSGLERKLLTRDLDGYAPGIDPKDAIDQNRVVEVANKYRLSPEFIRECYESLAQEFSLRLV